MINEFFEDDNQAIIAMTHQPFNKGFPLNVYGKDYLECLPVLQQVVINDACTVSLPEDSAALKCVRKGWLQSELVVDHLGQSTGKVIIVFPSDVHRK
jgi:hypothetical protein